MEKQTNKQKQEKKKKKRKEHRMIQRALGLWSKERLVRSFWPRCRLESPNLWAEKLKQVLSPFLLCSGDQTRHIPYKEARLGKTTLDSICLSTWNYIHGSELWLIVLLGKRKVFESSPMHLCRVEQTASQYISVSAGQECCPCSQPLSEIKDCWHSAL